MGELVAEGQQVCKWRIRRDSLSTLGVTAVSKEKHLRVSAPKPEWRNTVKGAHSTESCTAPTLLLMPHPIPAESLAGVLGMPFPGFLHRTLGKITACGVLAPYHIASNPQSLSGAEHLNFFSQYYYDESGGWGTWTAIR